MKSEIAGLTIANARSLVPYGRTDMMPMLLIDQYSIYPPDPEYHSIRRLPPPESNGRTKSGSARAGKSGAILRSEQ